MPQRKWWRLASGSTVTRSTSGFHPSVNRHAQVVTTAPTSGEVPLRDPDLHHSAARLSVCGEESLCWNMVFYAASKKQANPFHAFYPHCRQLQREALAIGKDVLLMPLRSRVTSFNFLEQWPFPHNCLGFCSLCTGATRLAGIWCYLWCWVPGGSSLWRVGDREESTKCWLVLVGFLSVRGSGSVWFWPAPNL